MRPLIGLQTPINYLLVIAVIPSLARVPALCHRTAVGDAVYIELSWLRRVIVNISSHDRTPSICELRGHRST